MFRKQVLYQMSTLGATGDKGPTLRRPPFLPPRPDATCENTTGVLSVQISIHHRSHMNKPPRPVPTLWNKWPYKATGWPATRTTPSMPEMCLSLQLTCGQRSLKVSLGGFFQRLTLVASFICVMIEIWPGLDPTRHHKALKINHQTFCG